MPPFKTVPSLVMCARDKVLYNVCAVILDEIFFSEDADWDIYGPPALSTRLSLVRDILVNSISPGIMEDLLNTILSRDEAVEPTVRYLALQLLLMDGVRNVAVGNFPESYYSMVLEAIAKNGGGIYKLDLRGIWVRQQDKFSALRVLRRLSDIRHLTLRYVCDNEMLATIGKYCSELHKLDVSGSSAISEEGLRNLCHNPHRIPLTKLTQSLQIVDLGGPGAQNLAMSHVSFLLLHLSHLVSLGSYDHTGAALEHILSTCPDRKFELRYLHDSNTTQTRFLAITKACPKLQAIYLDSPKGTVVHYLDMIKNLSEMKLHKVRYSDIEVALKKMGSQIRNLCLLSIFGQADMVDLGGLCPNLLRLELHSVSMVCSETSHANAYHKLRELLIYSSPVSSVFLKFLLNQCIVLEHLCLGECNQLTDLDITSNLRDHSLGNVRELWFGVAQQLTVNALEALIDHCPELVSIGNLAAWNVLPDELDLLRVQLLISNMELKLHEYGPDEEDQWVPVMAE